MRKTFKYRLYPSKSQRTKLNKTLEVCRQVYNRTLEIRKLAWEEQGESVSLYQSNKALTAWKRQKPEWAEVHSQVLQNVQERVDLAFKAFFRRAKAGEKPGYPRFKGFGRYGSFTFKQSGFALLDNGRLQVSKIGDIKIELHRPLEGEVKTLTLQTDGIGNWYACFSCVVEPKTLPPSAEMVGVDVGLSKFATLSTGESIPNPHFFKRGQRDLKRVQRKVSRLDKATPERRKAVKALNHIHTRIKNRRTDFAHQQSRLLVNRFQIIVFEKLDIREMMDDNFRAMNRSIADVAWGQLITFTSFKAAEAGRTELEVEPHGTSQGCSGCLEIVPKDLSVRVHSCPFCGLVLDRDHNAALNILARGLASLRLSSVEAHPL